MNIRQIRIALFTSAVAFSTSLAAQDAPIVQPGAPGQETRTVDARTATTYANTRYSEADVMFMQHMLLHHDQALQMADLVADRTQNSETIDNAKKIKLTQEDEIAFMREWLASHGEKADDPAMHRGHDMSAMMPGMLTAAQMKSLAAAKGPEFDRMFLELMIEHHQGAVTMAQNLFAKSGTAYDPALYEFVNELISDQNAEITRMTTQLSSLSVDPRVNLAAGFKDAGQAAMNLELVAALPKPTGFFDPDNPAELRLRAIDSDKGQKAADEGSSDTDDEESEGEETPPRFIPRGPMLTFGNTDMAFRDDLLVVGNYHGFNIYRLDQEGMPNLVSSVICPGGQGDVSLVGDTLIMSVEQSLGRVDCGTGGIDEDVSPDRMKGLRIFDVSDLTRPRQTGIVQTCRGSHTHSVVSLPDKNNTIVVYNSGTSSVREEEELSGCIGGIPGDPRTALFSIDVIEIPLDNPSRARVVDSPRVFADSEGNIAGLWRGGDHGDGTQRTYTTDQCHDITVFPTKNIAAGACSGNGILLDISNPRAPKRIDDAVDNGFAYWHSATFNNDGSKVLFTDEWGGGVMPRCQASDPKNWGADAIYDIVSNEMQRRGTYKIPAPQGEKENCVAHNGSIVPVPGRDVMVQAWYQGGLSVLDFTDSSNPFEIAFFDRGPIDADQRVIGGYWSAYFHRGNIYGSEIVRGLDVLRLKPSEFLTENEIAAAALAEGEGTFNPQRQTPVTWPAVPVVAQAYLDQLERSGTVEGATLANMRRALGEAQGALDAGQSNKPLAASLDENAVYARNVRAEGRAAARLTALADVLEQMAERLR